MNGNVSEWVADCYHKGFSNAPWDSSVAWATDCMTPERGLEANAIRMHRGGSWVDQDIRTSTRRFDNAGSGANDVGFRIGRTLY
jgi:formylglycine-generating enzyme required for sulfatase activity